MKAIYLFKANHFYVYFTVKKHFYAIAAKAHESQLNVFFLASNHIAV